MAVPRNAAPLVARAKRHRRVVRVSGFGAGAATRQVVLFEEGEPAVVELKTNGIRKVRSGA
jgi:hypothetical protein